MNIIDDYQWIFINEKWVIGELNETDTHLFTEFGTYNIIDYPTKNVIEPYTNLYSTNDISNKSKSKLESGWYVFTLHYELYRIILYWDELKQQFFSIHELHSKIEEDSILKHTISISTRIKHE